MLWRHLLRCRYWPQRACQSVAAGAGRCQGIDITQDACTSPLLYLAFFSQSRHHWNKERCNKVKAKMMSAVISELMGDHNLDNPVHAVLLTEEEKQEMRKVLDGDIYKLTARRRNYLILRLD